MMGVKAIGLLSGGLDSILAIRLLLDQGIEVLGLSFQTPFFGPDAARTAADQLGIPLVVQDITPEHFEIVKNPPHGRGRNMNPCVDCHGLMFRKAGEMCVRQGGQFIFSGEVLDERPFSQNRRALDVVAALSGHAELLLRPLSAQFLPETSPERLGHVDRGRLLDIRGRSRKPQMELAERYGIRSYPSPAGGCLLTDPAFSRRLKDLLASEPLAGPTDLELLKIGRHFRSPNGCKIIVGRNERENARLEALARPGDFLIVPTSTPGPNVLVPAGASEETLALACALAARYSDASDMEDVALDLRREDRVEKRQALSDPTFNPASIILR